MISMSFELLLQNGRLAWCGIDPMELCLFAVILRSISITVGKHVSVTIVNVRELSTVQWEHYPFPCGDHQAPWTL